MSEVLELNVDKITNKCFSFKFSGEKYQSLVKEIFAEKVKPCFNYTVCYNVTENDNVTLRVIAVMKNILGEIIAKQYIENGSSFATAEGTVLLAIEVFVSSKERGTLTISDISVHEEGMLKTRKAVLAAVALDYDSNSRSLELNLAENLEAIDAAAEEKPDIILLTEDFYDRNVFEDSLDYQAIDLNDPAVHQLRERAKKYHTYIAFCALIRLNNGNVSNMAVIIDRDGKICGEYKKTHLTIHEHDMGLEPGDEIVAFDLDFGRVAFAICWDLFFPEYTRMLQLNNVEIILNPSAGFKACRVSERACETGTYILSAGSHDPSESRITAPDGSFSVIGDKSKKYVCGTVELGKDYYIPWLSTSSSATMKNVFKFERRPDLYSLKRGDEPV